MTDRLTVAEIAALRPPARLPIAQWIEQNRVLHEAYAAEPGPKRIARTPFVKPILEAWADPWVREIVVQKSAQLGITDLAIDLIAHAAANDPSPMALFLADQLTAEKVMVDRVQSALRSVAALRGLIDENRLTQREAYLRNGFNLAVSWASSIAQTASRPFKALICDEINKPGYSAVGEEGSALGRLRQRQETFADSKLLMLSTPTGEDGNITRELASCDAVYDWHVPCPHCGVFQPLRFSPQTVAGMAVIGVVWEGGHTATSEQIEQTARYQCCACPALWTTTEKNAAVGHGRAVARGPVPPRARKVGFQLNRIMSLFPGGRLDKLVMDWIAAQQSPADLQNFVNSALGEPWVPKVATIDEDKIRRARCELPRGVVPDEAVALTCGVDTQKAGFWFRVRAWSVDGATSWGIDEGYLPSWQELETLLFSSDYHTAAGASMRIWRALIDIGGTKDHDATMSRTEEIQLWLRANGNGRGCRVFGCKGSSRDLPGNIHLAAPIDRTSTGKALPGGLQIVSIDTGKLKDAFMYALERAVDHDPHAAYLHAETEDVYFRHLAAEQKRKLRSGAVEWVQVKRDNHLLDCEVYCRAAVDPALFGGMRPFQLHQRRQAPAAAPIKPAPTANPFVGGTFSAGPNPYTQR